MNTEDRLRDALQEVADGTDVAPGSFERIERRTARARRRRAAVGGLAAAALVAVAVAVPLALRDDGESVQAGPGVTVSRDSTTVTDTTAAVPEPGGYSIADPPFAWPARHDDRRYSEPSGAARGFAERYLGMDQPVVEPLDTTGDAAARFVLRPRGEGGQPVGPDGPRTQVDVAQVSFAGVERYWAVVGARSPNLVVAEPSGGATITSPVTVSGVARNLFEGNVVVQLRDERSGPIGRQPTTATGSGPDLAAFSVEVPFEPTEGRGALVVTSDSGLQGTPEATVVPVTFGESTPGLTQVTVYMLDAQQDFVPVVRSVPRTQGVLRAALEQLLAGASGDDEARGLTSPFDDDRDLLRSVTITEDGTAVVDLAPDFGSRIPNSSTSAMSVAILGSLDRTVFQFPSVVRVSYRFGGGCGTFGEIDPAFLCEPRTRDEY